MEKKEKKTGTVKKKPAAPGTVKKTAAKKTPEKIIPEIKESPSTPKSEESSFDMVGILDRFRSKLLVTLLMFIIITPVAFYFSDILLHYINKPFVDSGNRLNIFTLMGGFMLKFKVSVAAALFVLVPFIIYQIWSIVVPSLNKTNRMFSRLSIISAVILFYSGVAFVFFLLLPAAVKVMLSFVGKDMLSTIGADSYLSFILFLVSPWVYFSKFR